MDNIPVPNFQGFVCTVAFLRRLSDLYVSITSVLGLNPAVQPILFQFLGQFQEYTSIRYYDTDNTRRALRGDFRLYGDRDRFDPNTQGYVGYRSVGTISITVANFQQGVETLLARLITDDHIVVETEGSAPSSPSFTLQNRNILFRQGDLIYRVAGRFTWTSDTTPASGFTAANDPVGLIRGNV